MSFRQLRVKGRHFFRQKRSFFVIEHISGYNCQDLAHLTYFMYWIVFYKIVKIFFLNEKSTSQKPQAIYLILPFFVYFFLFLRVLNHLRVSNFVQTSTVARSTSFWKNGQKKNKKKMRKINKNKKNHVKINNFREFVSPFLSRNPHKLYSKWKNSAHW